MYVLGAEACLLQEIPTMGELYLHEAKQVNAVFLNFSFYF